MNKEAFKQHLKNHAAETYPDWRDPMDVLYHVLPYVVVVTIIHIGNVAVGDLTWGDVMRSLAISSLVFTIAQAAWWLIGAVITGYMFRGYQIIQKYPGYRAIFMSRDDRKVMKWKFELKKIKKEIITGSATLDKDGNAWVVMRPGRHHHCIGFMYEHGKNHNIAEQGFMTNKGRFINRQDARKLAVDNGQAPTPNRDRDLYSEDLWDTPPYLRQH
jgi:hypothetical protein